MLSTDSSSMTNNCFGVLDKSSTSKYILGSENLALTYSPFFTTLCYVLSKQPQTKPMCASEGLDIMVERIVHSMA